jgi:hypothetical protein
MSVFYRVNFNFATNEDLTQAFALHEDTGAAADLSGGALSMSIAKEGVPVMSMTTANGAIQWADASTGSFVLSAPPGAFTALKPDVYEHDLVLTLNGRRKRIWEGLLTLQDGVTP